MKVSSPASKRARRAQSDPPSLPFFHGTVKKLVETPYFKRLVRHHVDLKCRQALKDGKIRLSAPQNPIYVPRVDIVEDTSSPRVVATFELPGVRNDEVTMHLHDEKLYISGERRPRIVSGGSGGQAGSPQPFHDTFDEGSPNDMAINMGPRLITLPAQELKYGKFQRALVVPKGLKQLDITARFQDGMLIVTWPRSSGTEVTAPQTDSESTPSSVAPVT